MKKLTLFFRTLIASVLIFILMFESVASAAIVNGEDAVDALGQFIDSYSPSFQQNYVENSQMLSGFRSPAGASIDTVNHRLFIADRLAHRVLVFNLDNSNQLTDYVADYVIGQDNFTTITSGRTQAKFNSPMSVEYDSTNNRLFVADFTNNRVMIFDLSSGITNGMNATYLLGQEDFTSSDTTANARSLSQPYDLAYDSTNSRLFVSSGNHHRTLIWDVAPATLTANSGTNGNHDADYCLGQNDFTSIALGNNAHQLNTPTGLVYDSANEVLYISEFGSSRVKTWTVDATTLADPSDDGTYGAYGNHPATAALGQTTITGSGTATADNRLSRPRGVALDPTNDYLYVADEYNDRIMVFDVETVTTGEAAVKVYGQDDFTTLGSGLSQNELNAPYFIEYDTTNDELIVPDYGNNRVIFYDGIGSTPISRFAYDADGVLGQTSALNIPDFTSDDVWNNGSIDEGYNYSEGIAIDHNNHRLFVTDGLGYRVLVYNLDVNDELVDIYPDYVLGQPTLNTITVPGCGIGDPEEEWCIGDPYDVAYDPDNDYLYVADGGIGRVMVFDVSTITNGETPVNVLGVPDLNTWGGLPGDADLATMSQPIGLEYADQGDRLFVSDIAYNRIMVYDLTSGITDGMNASVILGQPDATTESSGLSVSKLDSPAGIAYDNSTNRFYVADSGNNRVMVWSNAAEVSLSTGQNANYVLGQTNFTTGSQNTTIDGFDIPWDVDIDEANDLAFIADASNNRIMVYDIAILATGEDAVDVIGQDSFTSNASPAASASTLYDPSFLEYDTVNDRLYASDSSNHRVLFWDYQDLPAQPSGATNGENAIDVLGQYDNSSGSIIISYLRNQMYNLQRETGFYYPFDVELDLVNHRLFLTDTGHDRVIIHDLDGSNQIIDPVPENVLGAPSLSSYRNNAAAAANITRDVSALAYDSSGNRLFVADYYNRILVFDTSTITDDEDAVNVLGQSNFTTSTSGLTAGKFGFIEALEYDPDNNWLFASDSTNERVLVFDVASITDGENAIYVLGQEDFTSNDTTRDARSLNDPAHGLALDSTNDLLFVSDYGNHRVMVWDVSSAAMSGGTNGNHDASYVLGTGDFTSLDTSVSQASFRNPSGLAYDSSNNMLFVGNEISNRVLAFNTTTLSNGEPSVNVLGQENYTDTTDGFAADKLDYPMGMAVDSSNDMLYVADRYNNRIIVYEVGASTANSTPPTVSNLGPPSYIDGTSDSETQPTLTFDISDPVGENVKYQIQIDTSSSFDSNLGAPIINYESGFLAPGSLSYTVGQAAGSGNYIVGTENQFLNDGQYYWRVMATNVSDASSSWVEVTSGVYDFEVAYTAPNPARDCITFTKTDYADWTLPANQDNISANVALTRQNNRQIFNIVTEAEGTLYDCSWTPGDTEWEWAVCNGSNTFGNLFDENGCSPDSMVGEDYCLHTITDDEYYDIYWNSWTPGNAGGGFSYDRCIYPAQYAAGDPAPGPVTQIAPINGDSITDSTPLFEWTDIAGEAAYTIEVFTAADVTYSNPVLKMQDIPADATSQESNLYLADGDYTWRIYGVAAGGATDIPSATIEDFTISGGSLPTGGGGAPGGGGTTVPEYQHLVYVVTLITGLALMFRVRLRTLKIKK